MKKIAFILCLNFILVSCAALDFYLGVDEKGKDKPGAAPSEYVNKIIESLGPLGGVAGAGLAALGSAYVAHKQSKKPLDAVIAGVEKAKDELDEEEKAALTAKLKKHIPNKFHKAIDKIRDNL